MSNRAHPAATIAAVAAATSALVAGAVSVTATGPAVRDQLDFRFPGPTRRPGELPELALHNARYAAAALLACAAIARAPALRPVLDVVLAALLALNAIAVGLAWGGYGDQLLGAIALHGAVELAAFALCGATYLRARRAPLSIRDLALAALGAGLLLAGAAALEVYISLEEVLP